MVRPASLGVRELKKGIVIILALTGILGAFGRAGAETALSAQDVRERALQFNRNYLAAREDVAKAESDIIKARAGAFPSLNLLGSYSRNVILPSFFVNPEGEEPVEFKTGLKNAFGASLALRQSLWQGGKVFTAWAIAKQYKKYAEAQAGRVAAEVVYNADLLFYSAVLEQSRLNVLNTAFETNSLNLEMVEKLYSQGMVSEFEVLRARVEKSNLLPQILRVESDLRLSRKRLKSFIGIDLEEAIILIEDEGDTSLVRLPSLQALTDSALALRSEVKQAEYLADISKKAIRIAKGGYYPSLEAVSTYSWQSQSDDFTLSENQTDSWSIGINLRIPIFQGGYTRGEVKESRATYNQARLAAMQLKDDVRLDVEEAYDQILQAKKALDIQGETIAEAEAGLRIANLRYETGVGTQLEVLSAQTALTQARQALAEATFFFRQAHSLLNKATNIIIKTDS
ncbi:MAG: TolC family protein [candidate division Zixibacteria bacterium]|nr:TolC family protein [candidate division Zixibacteria bacterium]